MRTDFNLLDQTSQGDILATLSYLSAQELTETGHDFDKYGAIPIMQAAARSVLAYSDRARERPAVALIEVVLAANRNYNRAVAPKIKSIIAEYPQLRTFGHLSNMIASMTMEEFYKIWGHDDEKKYNTLKALLAQIDLLRLKYPDIGDDFRLMNRWGASVDMMSYEDDAIASIRNIGLATFQHLRMNFGVDTVKPDLRVKQVLEYEFGLRGLSGAEAIFAVEQIALIAKEKVIFIDQVLVKYGSSYYNHRIARLTPREIAVNLKKYGVDKNVISKATMLTLKQVERL